MEVQTQESVQIEWLILADAAQVVGNKLYLIGGGWDVLTVNTVFPVHQRCAVAASFRVPWNETNVKHNVEVLIATEDREEIARIRGQFEVGRPAGLPPGTVQRAQIAVDLGLELRAPGAFVIVAAVDGGSESKAYFRAIPGLSPTVAKDRS